MIYAQIKNGFILNAFVIEEENIGLLPLFIEGFDLCLRIDDLAPQPGIGWSYDGSDFWPPSQ